MVVGLPSCTQITDYSLLSIFIRSYSDYYVIMSTYSYVQICIYTKSRIWLSILFFEYNLVSSNLIKKYFLNKGKFWIRLFYRKFIWSLWENILIIFFQILYVWFHITYSEESFVQSYNPSNNIYYQMYTTPHNHIILLTDFLKSVFYQHMIKLWRKKYYFLQFWHEHNYVKGQEAEEGLQHCTEGKSDCFFSFLFLCEDLNF